MAETVKTNYEKSTQYVNVAVYENPFADDGSSYAKVMRNTSEASNLIADIVEKTTNRFDEPLLMYAAGLFKSAILTKLESGDAVNLFDLGTLYLTAHGSITGDSPTATDIPELSVAFTPSSTTKEAVAKVEISVVQKAASTPSIDSVVDYTTGATDGTVTAGGAVSVLGQRLKTAGEGSGVWLVAADEDGSYDDEGESFEAALIIKNLPSELCFVMPDGLSEGGSYYIVVQTALSGSHMCKSLKTGVSGFAVTVAAASDTSEEDDSEEDDSDEESDSGDDGDSGSGGSSGD